MLEQGSSIRDVAKALHLGVMTVQRAKARLIATDPGAEGLKSGLLSPQRDENAGKLIDHFISKGLKMKQIKGSDALGAVKMYADRRWPTQQAAPGGPPVSFVQINIESVRLNDNPEPGTLDVTPPCAPSAIDGL